MDRRRFLDAVGAAILAEGIDITSTFDQLDHLPRESRESPSDSTQTGETITAKVNVHAHLKRGGGQQTGWKVLA